MKLALLLLSVFLSFDVTATTLGRSANAQRLGQHVLMLHEQALSNLVDPNNKKRIRSEAEFDRFNAAAVCATMSAMLIDYPLLKIRAASEMDRGDAAQVAIHDALDEQRERLRVLAFGFCEIKESPTIPAGRPSDALVVGLVKLRNEMRWTSNKTFTNMDYSRLDTAYYMKRAHEVTSGLKKYTHAENGSRIPALSSVGSYMRMCYSMSAGILYLGVANASRDDFKQDAGRTTMDRCDNLVESTHVEGKNILAEFCLSEKRGLGITPGELTDPLVSGLGRLTARMKTIAETCN